MSSSPRADSPQIVNYPPPRENHSLVADTADSRRPRIVIVGEGFGGLSAAKALRGAEADVALIDRKNHHLFQPLLYQVATAALSPADIAHPVRAALRGADNIEIRMDEVVDVNVEGGM